LAEFQYEKKCGGQTDKPDSVDGQSSIWGWHCCQPRCDPLGIQTGEPPISLFGLAPRGVYNATVSGQPLDMIRGTSPNSGRRPSGALTSRFHLCHPTFRVEFGRVFSVALSFRFTRRNGFPDWTLSSTLLCGVRTFLPSTRPPSADSLGVTVWSAQYIIVENT
jgi:hypothetical protein